MISGEWALTFLRVVFNVLSFVDHFERVQLQHPFFLFGVGQVDVLHFLGNLLRQLPFAFFVFLLSLRLNATKSSASRPLLSLIFQFMQQMDVLNERNELSQHENNNNDDDDDNDDDDYNWWL